MVIAAALDMQTPGPFPARAPAWRSLVSPLRTSPARLPV